MRIHAYQFHAGGIYHIYNHAAQNMLLFKDKDDYSLCLKMFKEYFSSSDFSVIAVCMMPNHYHLLLRQNGECPPYMILNKLWFRYAKYYNKKYGGKGSIFAQKAQHKLIENSKYLQKLITYIFLNPLMAGLVDQVSEWEWSSYHECVGRRSLIPSDQSIRDAYFRDICDLNDVLSAIASDKLMKEYTLEQFITCRDDWSSKRFDKL